MNTRFKTGSLKPKFVLPLPASPLLKPKDTNASSRKVVVRRIEKSSLTAYDEALGNDISTSKQDGRKMSKSDRIGCAACLSVFDKQSALNTHVTQVHAAADNVVSLFFSDVEEFTQWKQTLETSNTFEYLNYDGNSIKTLVSNASSSYTCNAETEVSATPLRIPSPHATYYCPSRINVQVYTTGVHVLYYKRHHGHKSQTYQIPEWCKRFVTSNLIHTQWHNKFLESPEVNVLTKFNIVMHGIANEAEKVPEETLRVLHGKAIEMLLMINMPKEKKGDAISKFVGQKVMKGDGLEKELREMNKSRLFMPKLQVEEVKQKVVMPKPMKVVHAFSVTDIEMELKQDLDDDVNFESVEIKDEVEIEEHDLEDVLSSKRKMAAKTADLENTVLSKRKSAPMTCLEDVTLSKRKTAPKTTPTPRMAAPKPQTPTVAALKPQTPTVAAPKPQTPTVAAPQTQKEAQTPETPKAWHNNSPSSFNDTYKSFLEQSIQEQAYGKGIKMGIKMDHGNRKKNIQPSKQKIKTKLGFQPLLRQKKSQKREENKREREKNKPLEIEVEVETSPISEPMRKVSRNSSICSDKDVKVKIEKYEVMEQENDCNILILKF